MPTPRWWRSWPRAWPAASTNRACAPAPACRPSARWPSNPASVVSPWWKHTTGWSLAGWQSRRGVFCAPAAAPWPPSRPRPPIPLAAPGGRGLGCCAACSAKPPSTACRAAPACCRRTGWIPNGGGRRARGGPVGARPARVLRPPAGFRRCASRSPHRCRARACPPHPERNLLTTNGVTHALDLINARHLVKPGDMVLVEDPACS